MTRSQSLQSSLTTRVGLSGLLGILFLSAGPGLHGQNDNGYDPPNRVARVSVIQGNVSLEPSGVDSFSQAEINYPLTSGDRIFADNNSFGELQTAGLAVRLGNGADVTVSSLTDDIAQFGLAQGSIRVRTRSLSTSNGQPGTVEVDTPNGAIIVDRPGDIRVDSYPQDDTTVVTVSSGAVEVTGQNLDQQLGPEQSLRLSGSNPVYAEQVQLLPPDNLDQFDRQRESRRERSYASQYVSPDMIGAGDLDDYGDWQAPNQDNQGYGAVWYPRGVPAGWTPYSNGHWAWVAPWGWTWVEAEPWGFAPFHYGRWANFGGRWGWVPGPPASAFGGEVRPIYSPALVAFVGGGNGFSISIGAVAAWFPLGPREAYQPWYHASPAYCNRVNVTNIYNTNVTEIHNTYINRTVNVYNTVNVTKINYVNRNQATVIVPQRALASGQSVVLAQRTVPLTPGIRAQLSAAPILPHPLVTPVNAIAAPRAPARAVPPMQIRPVLVTRQGFERAGAPGTPVPAPHAPVAVNRPAQQPVSQPINRAGFPQQRQLQVIAPAPVNRPVAEPAPMRPPVVSQPTVQRPVQVAPPQPPRANTPPPAAPTRPQPIAAPIERPVPRPLDQPRPLINKTPPPPVQPPFIQQRRAIQAADPGRPLGPQQVDNLRNGRPVGPAQQPEAPHPLPALRPNAAPPGKPRQANEPQPPR